MNKRPCSRLSKEVFEEAKPRIIEVLKKCPIFEGEDEDSLEEGFKCISEACDMDGYKLAKRLDEDLSVEPTELDVEELGIIGPITYDAFESLQRKWVTENGIVVSQKVGDVVSFKHGSQQMIGTVNRVLPETAKLVVEVKDRRGNPIVNFEDAKLEGSSFENAQVQ